MKLIGGALLWILLGIPGMGWFAASLAWEFPEQSIREHVSVSMLVSAIGGPIASVDVFFVTGFAEHGWCITVQQCKAIAESPHDPYR